MKHLKYKGIIFDCYEQDEDGHYWSEICADCVEKYRDLIIDDIDDGGVACGACGVKGCDKVGDSNEEMHHYIDFKEEFIEFVEGGSENEQYDEQYI